MKGAIPTKTKEELTPLKEEVETLSRKLHELTDEELAQVSGGIGITVYFNNRLGEVFYTDGLYVAHVKATGEIRSFTNQKEAEDYLRK